MSASFSLDLFRAIEYKHPHKLLGHVYDDQNVENTTLQSYILLN